MYINFLGRIFTSTCYMRSAEFLALNCVLWEPSAICVSLLEKKWDKELYAKAAKELSVGSASCYYLLKSLQSWKDMLCCLTVSLNKGHTDWILAQGHWVHTGKNLLVVGRNEEGCSLSLAAYILWKLLLGVTNSRKFMGNGKKEKGGSFLPCQLWPWESAQ